MSDSKNGSISVSLLAGNITATTRPLHPEIGQQIRMNDDFYFHITPEVAAQWLPVITKIAEAK